MALIINTYGSIAVTSLGALSDVNITLPATGDYLRYDGSTLEWQNSSILEDTYSVISSTVSAENGVIVTHDNIGNSTVLGLSTTGVAAGTYTTANITVDAYGRITFAENGVIGGSGTVTSVDVASLNGVTVSGGPITNAGTITIGLGAITPTSVTSTGTVSGSNLSGTNTGDQTITLTGDVTGSGTGSFVTSLSNTGVTAGTYGSSTLVPVVTLDDKGRVTNVSTAPVSGGGGGSIPLIRTPVHTAPSNGATGVALNPTLSTTRYGSVYGIPQLLSRWQVATDSGFTTVIHDSGDASATDPFSNTNVFYPNFNQPDGSTLILDQSQYHEVVTIGGNSHISHAEIASRSPALDLDGANDYISFPVTQLSGYTGDITIELSFKLRSLPTANDWQNSFYVFNYGPNMGDAGCELYLGSSLIKFNAASYSSITISASWVPDTTNVHHLAVVKSGSLWSIYLDGLLLNRVINPTGLLTHSGTVQIGGCEAQSGGANDGWFDGWIFDYRISKMARYDISDSVPTVPYLSGTPAGLTLLVHGDGPDGSTTITDVGPHTIPVVLSGGVDISTDQPGISTSSIDFNGTDGYLALTSTELNLGNSDFSWECRIYRRQVTDLGYSDAIWYASTGPSGMAVSIDPSGRIGVSISSDGSSWNVRRGSDPGDPKGTHTLLLNTWYRVAVYRKGDNWQVYVNDELDQFFTSTATISSPPSNTYNIGKCHDSWTRWFNGYIQEIRVVKGPTSPFPSFDSTVQLAPATNTANTYTVPVALSSTTTYYWRCQHTDDELLVSDWSSTTSFVTV